MSRTVQMLKSTVTRKYVMAITGLMLTLFVVMHLIGNLQLLIPGGEMFNNYAHHLEQLGKLLVMAEIGLVVACLLHVAFAIVVTKESADARPLAYAMQKTKGGESKNNFSSRNMLLLGCGLLVFLVIHIWQFKYGTYYKKNFGAEAGRDLYRLVFEVFHQPGWVIFYVGMMFFLLLHLRHGIWSMFQSLGAMPRKWSVCGYALGGAIAVLLLAVGFMILPIVIYLMPLAWLPRGVK